MVIYYASRTLDGTQQNYATTEKELLTVVYTIEKFKPYVLCFKVIVYTDHSTPKLSLRRRTLSLASLDGFYSCKSSTWR